MYEILLKVNLDLWPRIIEKCHNLKHENNTAIS